MANTSNVPFVSGPVVVATASSLCMTTSDPD